MNGQYFSFQQPATPPANFLFRMPALATNACSATRSSKLSNDDLGQGRLGAAHLCLFVGVDLDLGPTVYIAVIVPTRT